MYTEWTRVGCSRGLCFPIYMPQEGDGGQDRNGGISCSRYEYNMGVKRLETLVKR